MKPECGQRQEGRSSNEGPVKNNLGVLETPKCLRDKFSLILPFFDFGATGDRNNYTGAGSCEAPPSSLTGALEISLSGCKVFVAKELGFTEHTHRTFFISVLRR